VLLTIVVSFYVFVGRSFLFLVRLILSTGATDFLESPVYEMTCYVSNGTLDSAQSLAVTVF